MLKGMNIESLGAIFFQSSLPSRLRCICGRDFTPEPDQERTCSATCAYREAETRLTGLDPFTRCCCGRWFKPHTTEVYCSTECAGGQLERSAFSDDSDDLESDDDEVDTSVPITPPHQTMVAPYELHATTSYKKLKHPKGRLPEPVEDDVPPPVPPKDFPPRVPLPSRSGTASSSRPQVHPSRSKSADDHKKEQTPPAPPPRPKGGHKPARGPVASVPVPDKPSHAQTVASSVRRARSCREPDDPTVPRTYIPPHAREPISTSSRSATVTEHPGHGPEWRATRSGPSSLTRQSRVRRVAFKHKICEEEPERGYGPGVSRSNTVPLRSALRKDIEAVEPKARPTSDPAISPITGRQRIWESGANSPKIHSSSTEERVECERAIPATSSTSDEEKYFVNGFSIVDYRSLIPRDSVHVRWKPVPDVPEDMSEETVDSSRLSISSHCTPSQTISSQNRLLFLERVPNQPEVCVPLCEQTRLSVASGVDPCVMQFTARLSGDGWDYAENRPGDSTAEWTGSRDSYSQNSVQRFVDSLQQAGAEEDYPPRYSYGLPSRDSVY